LTQLIPVPSAICINKWMKQRNPCKNPVTNPWRQKPLRWLRGFSSFLCSRFDVPPLALPSVSFRLSHPLMCCVLVFPYSDVAAGCHPRFCFFFDIRYANPDVARLAAVRALTVLLSRMSPMGFVAVVAILPPVTLWRLNHGAALIHSVCLLCRCFHPWVVSNFAHRWCRRVCVESRLVPSRSVCIIHAKF